MKGWYFGFEEYMYRRRGSVIRFPEIRQIVEKCIGYLRTW